jgi:hypothetical protein
VAGGIGAELGGGKFTNGAQTGAFSYLFNDLLTVKSDGTVIKCEGDCVLIPDPDNPGEKIAVNRGFVGKSFGVGNAAGSVTVGEAVGAALTVTGAVGAVRATTTVLFGEAAGFLRTACVAISICSPNRVELTGQLVRDRAIVREAGRRATSQESRDQIVK